MQIFSFLANYFFVYWVIGESDEVISPLSHSDTRSVYREGLLPVHRENKIKSFNYRYRLSSVGWLFQQKQFVFEMPIGRASAVTFEG